MSEQDISGVMVQAMSAENRRRLLASQRPGHGAQVPMEQPAAGPAVGKYGVPGLDVVGEGYSVVAGVSPAVSKAYGPDRPQYGDDLIGGIGFVGGRQEAPITVYLGQRSQPADGVVFVSPPARPSLWQRLTGRRRRR
jgi:hypothetical protein